MTTNAIGIDLGTTHCCVAVYQNDKPEIISNSYGNRTTPSWVAFNETECLVGDAAKMQAAYNPENTIYDMKRLIGQRYEDSTIQSDIANWPFKVFCCDGMPKIEIMHEGVSKAFKPEEISAIILKELKKTAEEYLEAEVTKAVITVPAYFSDYQRQATMDAAKIAGLEVLRLLHEPTAAAVAYVCSKIEVNGTLLLVDIGGGTLDVSIVVAKGSEFTVKATKGNTHLGGEDFTNNLMDHVINLCKKKHNKDLKSNKKALCRLRHRCEVAKRMLSYCNKVPICVDCITDGIDLNEEISKCQFEAVNSYLFNKILETVKGALTCGNMTKEDIDKVLMVGGSSKMPKIRTILQNFFDKPVYASINPDEAIAAGAGIYAAMHSGIDIRDKKGFTMQDIIPTSLGIGLLNDEYSILLKKYSCIPTSKSYIYKTAYDNQVTASIPVYEGEDLDANNNKSLGKIVLEEIPPKPEGEEEIEVTFSIDRNGILTVSAKIISTENEIRATIDRRF